LRNATPERERRIRPERGPRRSTPPEFRDLRRERTGRFWQGRDQVLKLRERRLQDIQKRQEETRRKSEVERGRDQPRRREDLERRERPRDRERAEPPRGRPEARERQRPTDRGEGRREAEARKNEERRKDEAKRQKEAKERVEEKRRDRDDAKERDRDDKKERGRDRDEERERGAIADSSGFRLKHATAPRAMRAWRADPPPGRYTFRVSLIPARFLVTPFIALSLLIPAASLAVPPFRKGGPPGPREGFSTSRLRPDFAEPPRVGERLALAAPHHANVLAVRRRLLGHPDRILLDLLQPSPVFLEPVLEPGHGRGLTINPTLWDSVYAAESDELLR
jgi:hypothetical protein